MHMMPVLDAKFMDLLMSAAHDLPVFNQENNILVCSAGSDVSRLNLVKQLLNRGIVGDFDCFRLLTIGQINLYLNFLYHIFIMFLIVC